ncbi:hypothetical protein P4910_21275 [Pantoea stewartii]|uniref:hypothetical protein n=1 Tax=Pantoea stewartii TaxID=66269 RepID=UPI0023F8125B|nr:hypothetical protein [Pantoea stewartii]MDF7787987.1 hypothetical protein [Pantoea stewartii]
MIVPFDLRRATIQSSDSTSNDDEDASAFLALISSLQDKLKVDHSVKKEGRLFFFSTPKTDDFCPDLIKSASNPCAYISGPYGEINLCENPCGEVSDYIEADVIKFSFCSEGNKNEGYDSPNENVIPEYVNLMPEDQVSLMSWMICISKNTVSIKVRR